MSFEQGSRGTPAQDAGTETLHEPASTFNPAGQTVPCDAEDREHAKVIADAVCRAVKAALADRRLHLASGAQFALTVDAQELARKVVADSVPLPEPKPKDAAWRGDAMATNAAPPSSAALAAALRDILWKDAFEARRFARALDRVRTRLPQHEAVLDFLIDALSFEDRAPTPDLPTAA